MENTDFDKTPPLLMYAKNAGDLNSDDFLMRKALLAFLSNDA